MRTSFCWIPSCDQSRDSAYLVTYQIKDNGCPLPLLVNGKFRIKVNKLQVIDKPNFLCLHFESDDIIKLIKVPDNTINARYFKGYTLYRSKNNSAFTALKHISDPFENIFYDSTATDNLHNIYCYYLTGTNNCNYESDNSDTLCSDNASNGNKNYIESVSVEAKNIISMKWEPFQDSYYAVYSIYRKKNSPEAAFEKVVELKNYADFEWKDFTVSTSENSYCYQMLNENVCGNISDISDDACSILLKGNADLFIDKLNWTSYINWRGNVGSYKTERNDENINIPYHDVNVIPFADTIAEDRDLPLDGGIFNYRIRAFEGSGGTGESLSNEIELIQAPALYLPTAFSPNADSKNDKWGFESVFVKSFNLILFNRWGQQIYHTDSPEDKWDGKYNGDEVPQGVYFFKLEFTGYNSKKVFEKSGSVTVIR